MKYLNLCIAIVPMVMDVASAIPSHFSRPCNKQNKDFQGLSLAEIRGGSKTKAIEMKQTSIRDDAPFSSMLKGKFKHVCYVVEASSYLRQRQIANILLFISSNSL